MLVALITPFRARGTVNLKLFTAVMAIKVFNGVG